MADKTLQLKENNLALERMGIAIRTAFLDEAMRELPEVKDSQINFGSTAVACLITPTHLFIANCGDSRAILVSDDQLAIVTKDHKPNDPIEKARIEQEGGTVAFYYSTQTGELSLTRAFGDYNYKKNELKGPCERMVSAEPEIYCHERFDKDEFLVLASDGLWDLLSSKHTKKFIQRCRYDPYPEELTKSLLAHKVNENEVLTVNHSVFIRY